MSENWRESLCRFAQTQGENTDEPFQNFDPYLRIVSEQCVKCFICKLQHRGLFHSFMGCWAFMLIEDRKLSDESAFCENGNDQLIAFKFGLFLDLNFSWKNKSNELSRITFLKDYRLSRIRDRFKKTGDFFEVLFIKERKRYLFAEFAEIITYGIIRHDAPYGTEDGAMSSFP